MLVCAVDQSQSALESQLLALKFELQLKHEEELILDRRRWKDLLR